MKTLYLDSELSFYFRCMFIVCGYNRSGCVVGQYSVNPKIECKAMKNLAIILVAMAFAAGCNEGETEYGNRTTCDPSKMPNSCSLGGKNIIKCEQNTIIAIPCENGTVCHESSEGPVCLIE